MSDTALDIDDGRRWDTVPIWPDYLIYERAPGEFFAYARLSEHRNSFRWRGAMGATPDEAVESMLTGQPVFYKGSVIPKVLKEDLEREEARRVDGRS
jgi:hypothetical protein